MSESINIDLKIEVESLLGKLGIDFVYDPEIGGWFFREKSYIVFMTVNDILQSKFLSFFVKVGELSDPYEVEKLYELLHNNMKLAFASFGLTNNSIYMRYTTQINELDSEEFLVALKVVSFSIEKCIDIVKKLIKTP